MAEKDLGLDYLGFTPPSISMGGLKLPAAKADKQEPSLDKDMGLLTPPSMAGLKLPTMAQTAAQGLSEKPRVPSGKELGLTTYTSQKPAALSGDLEGGIGHVTTTLKFTPGGTRGVDASLSLGTNNSDIQAGRKFNAEHNADTVSRSDKAKNEREKARKKSDDAAVDESNKGIDIANEAIDATNANNADRIALEQAHNGVVYEGTVTLSTTGENAPVIWCKDGTIWAQYGGDWNDAGKYKPTDSPPWSNEATFTQFLNHLEKQINSNSYNFDNQMTVAGAGDTSERGEEAKSRTKNLAAAIKSVHLGAR